MSKFELSELRQVFSQYQSELDCAMRRRNEALDLLKLDRCREYDLTFHSHADWAISGDHLYVEKKSAFVNIPITISKVKDDDEDLVVVFGTVEGVPSSVVQVHGLLKSYRVCESKLEVIESQEVVKGNCMTAMGLGLRTQLHCPLLSAYKDNVPIVDMFEFDWQLQGNKLTLFYQNTEMAVGGFVAKTHAALETTYMLIKAKELSVYKLDPKKEVK